MIDSSATITGAASTPLVAKPGRTWVFIQNRSADNIWFNIGGTATVAGAGCIGLIGLGANVRFTAKEIPVYDAISFISSGASSGVTILSDK